MAKELRTRVELESLVRDRIKQVPISYFEVQPDPTSGWRIFFTAAPNLVIGCTPAIDSVERELRALYDLRS
jgi:hypothetical protein